MSIYQNFLVILLCQTLRCRVTFVVTNRVTRSIYMAVSVDSCQYFQDLHRKECFWSKEHLVKLSGGPASQPPAGLAAPHRILVWSLLASFFSS